MTTTLPLVEPLVASLPAQRALEASGGAARVSGVFAHSVNLSCAGWVVNVSRPGIRGACALQVDDHGESLLRSAGVGSRWTVTAAPRTVPAGRPAGRSAGAAIRGAARSVLADAAAASWFHSGGAARGASLLGRVAGSLVRVCTSGRADPGVAALPLVGLGIGLTPSGDDAVVAMLCLMTAWGRGPWPNDPLGARLTSGEAVTTDVSSTALRLALVGEFSPDLADVVSDLDSPEALAGSVARVLTHGATSGSDAVAGLLALLRAAADTPSRTRKDG